ncbi:hypothetical protein HOY82DRAFT_490372, partial [Tuber indicum]
GSMKKEGVTTLCSRCVFRMSTFRAQADIQGKSACILENRATLATTLTSVGNMDHL